MFIYYNSALLTFNQSRDSSREQTRVIADLLTKSEKLNTAMDLTITVKEDSTQRKH